MNSPKKSTPKQRQLIQIGRRTACWDHDTHVAFMEERYKKSSTLALTYNQAKDYLAHLRKGGHVGWGTVKGRKQAEQKDTLSQDDYIQLLWKQLGEADKLRDPSEASLNKFVKGTVGIDHLDWCNSKQKSKIITVLRRWKGGNGGE